jgi:pyruvate kinase
MSVFQKTKIVATMGPAITQKLFTVKDFNDPKNSELAKLAHSKMEEAIKAGVNVARFNFSHGTQEEHLIRINLVRDTSKKLDMPVHTLLDTKGPEIRVDSTPGDEPITFSNGDNILIRCKDKVSKSDGAKSFSVTDSTGTYNMAKDVVKGKMILVDDGKLILEVLSKNDSDGIINVVAKNTHTIKKSKRINLPGTEYSMPFFSQKDRDDVLFALKNNMDYIALSFSNTKADIMEVRNFIEANKSVNPNHNIKLIAKVETGVAIENLKDLVEASDGIMVARGDLGIEIPYDEVPYWEKAMIRECRAANKPVIVATQMLDSLERTPLPTRAEVTDVFFAVENSTDATMLSGETAQGLYPIEAIKVMGKIIKKAEQTFNYNKAIKTFAKSKISKDPVSREVTDLADSLMKKYVEEIPSVDSPTAHIFVFTNDIKKIRALSSIRLHKRIIAVTDSAKVSSEFGLYYGVNVVKLDALPKTKSDRESFVQKYSKKLPNGTECSIFE